MNDNGSKELMVLAPSILAARTMVSSTDFTPAKVFTVIVGKHARNIRKYLDISSKPNHAINSGIHAMGGIGQ